MLRRRIEELKGWQAVGALLKLGPRDASERLDDRLAIEMGLLEGVDPRLDEKDIMVEFMSRGVDVLIVGSESKSSRLQCDRQAKGREVQSCCSQRGDGKASNNRRGGKGDLLLRSADLCSAKGGEAADIIA